MMAKILNDPLRTVCKLTRNNIIQLFAWQAQVV